MIFMLLTFYCLILCKYILRISYDSIKVNNNKVTIILILFISMLISGIIRYYFITFFPIYWKNNRPNSGEGMAIWMVNCIEFSVIYFIK